MPIKRTAIDPAYREGNPDPDKDNGWEAPACKFYETRPFRKTYVTRGPQTAYPG